MKKLYKVIAALLALIIVAFGLREYTDYIKDYTLKHSNHTATVIKAGWR